MFDEFMPLPPHDESIKITKESRDEIERRSKEIGIQTSPRSSPDRVLPMSLESKAEEMVAQELLTEMEEEKYEDFNSANSFEFKDTGKNSPIFKPLTSDDWHIESHNLLPNLSADRKQFSAQDAGTALQEVGDFTSCIDENLSHLAAQNNLNSVE